MNGSNFNYDGAYEICPVCGAEAFMAEVIEEPRTHVNLDQQINFYSCSLCGYTKQKEVVDTHRGTQVVEVYDVDAIPPLVRRGEGTNPDSWKYFFGEDEVAESTWWNEFESRQEAMRGILN